jgi:general secretion pathway protein L
MQIVAVWTRWIDMLASLCVAMQEAWRARHPVSVALENKRLVVRSGDGSRGKLPKASELAAAARRHFITLELPPDEVVLQRIDVPAQAREFLAGIVRNRIDHLSPWPADQVVYGFDVVASEGAADTLDTHVLMTSRAVVEAAQRDLAALGIAADRMVAHEAGRADAPPVTLWSRFDGEAGRGLERARRTVAAAVLATIMVSVGLTAWSLASASAIRAESEDLAGQAAALQRRLAPTRTAAASLPLPERAWALKETAPAAVRVLDTLSQALPDRAYLTELTLQKSTVRIVGLASDAPALIAPLEQSGQFADVHFFAPSTRGPDGRLFWFHIEARVEPRRDARED